MTRLCAIPVRLIDTGLAGGIHNSAIDGAGLELRALGRATNVLRFHRSHPTASIGRHQALARELRLDYCRRRGIEVVRRATSGGALYLDSRQLGFSLIMQQPEGWRDLVLPQLLARGGAAVAAALRQLGIAAVFKPANDIEVDGRKIASVFVARRYNAVLLHGSVLLDVDVETMLKALRCPTKKLSADGPAAAQERLIAVNALRADRLSLAAVKTALANGIAAEFGLELRADSEAMPSALSPVQLAAEQALAQSIAWNDDGGTAKLEALLRTAGGTLRARAHFAPPGMRLHGIEFATDAHLEPADFFGELQRALEGSPMTQGRERIAGCLRRRTLDAVGFGVAEIERLLRQLADKHAFAQRSGLGVVSANALMPHTATGELDTAGVPARASVMLVPHCAKPACCEWHRRDGCDECDPCEVGTAYALARERNMQVTTVTDYEQLVATLADLKARRIEAYVGMCCSNFFIERYRAFAEAGVPALLMDIGGANCYELQQEEQAYAGTFQAEAQLDAELVTRVMQFVPRQPGSSCAARNHEIAGHP